MIDEQLRKKLYTAICENEGSREDILFDVVGIVDSLQIPTAEEIEKYKKALWILQEISAWLSMNTHPSKENIVSVKYTIDEFVKSGSIKYNNES